MWNSDQVTPEMRLIRMCCRYALGYMSIIDCVPYLDVLLDETKLIAQADEHRLVVLVYQVLSKDFNAYINPSVLQALGKKAQIIIRDQLKLMGAAGDVRQALTDARIPHVFLKGPSLNRMLWGRRMMRYSGDIDVLVEPRDVFKAHHALHHIQFYPECSEKTLRFHQRLYRLSTKRDVSYWREGFSKRVELHWKSYGTEFVFKPGVLPELSPEAYVLYLCLHAAKHAWTRMIWLVDIVAFIRIKKIDVTQLRARAKAQHIAPVVDEALLLAELWLGINLLPDEGRQILKKYDKRLKKRLVWGKKAITNKLWQEYKRVYFTNAFCSSFWRQQRLWMQVFVGVTCSVFLRKLKR
jgi:hypothetical protein